jgi:hypothetical protein
MTGLLLLASFLYTQGSAQDHPASELVGRWRGTSVCTKADWNSACHDETVVYECSQGAAPGQVLLRAFKIVQGKPEFMGDLTFSWDDRLRAWVASFANERVHLRVTLEPKGDTLEGRMVLLPEMRVGRQMHVTRDRTTPTQR